ncbi:MAG: hypothetical protein ACJ8F3_02860 [Xanthobacteraceae bacterium]
MNPDAESIDFKPFFDMIVGILFILLILISAQLFFAQHASDETYESQEARRIALERERQTLSFLEEITLRLRTAGLEANVDRFRRAVRLPLQQVLAGSAASVPSFSDPALATLGRVLANRLPCVLAATPRPADCRETGLLQLGAVDAELRPNLAASPLAPDRYAQLAMTLFSAGLLRAQPDLLALTNAAGTPALRFSGVSASGQPAAAGAAAATGELSLLFVFQQ